MKHVLPIAILLLLSVTAFAKQDTTKKQAASSAASTPKQAQSPATPNTATKAPKVATQMTGRGAYEVRLQELRDKVNALKTKVFDAKTRLLLLREQILHNLVSESKLQVIHYNDASSILKLKSVAYYLDDDKIYGSDNRNDTLNKRRQFVVYNGSVSPTHHVLSVRMVYQGGSGFFSYVKAYKFTVKGSLPFFAARGQKVIIRVVGFQKGGLTSLENSPTMRFELRRINLTEKALKAANQKAK